MSPVEKQSILILIESLETQLRSLKALVGMAGVSGKGLQLNKKPEVDADFTSEEEDKLIGESLAIDGERDMFMRDLFDEAREKAINDEV